MCDNLDTSRSHGSSRMATWPHLDMIDDCFVYECETSTVIPWSSLTQEEPRWGNEYGGVAYVVGRILWRAVKLSI